LGSLRRGVALPSSFELDALFDAGEPALRFGSGVEADAADGELVEVEDRRLRFCCFLALVACAFSARAERAFSRVEVVQLPDFRVALDRRGRTDEAELTSPTEDATEPASAAECFLVLLLRFFVFVRVTGISVLGASIGSVALFTGEFSFCASSTGAKRPDSLNSTVA